MAKDSFKDIKTGSIVTIVNPRGIYIQGRASVNKGPDEWTIHLNNRPGDPASATRQNTIGVSPPNHPVEPPDNE